MSDVVAGSTRVRILVVGVPAPQGSKVRTASGFMREMSSRVADWRDAVAKAAALEMDGRQQLLGPLQLNAEFRFPRPQAHFRTGLHAGALRSNAPTLKTSAPDLDKLLRAVGDAITGIVCANDAQIADVAASKTYGSPPGVVLILTELEPRP